MAKELPPILRQYDRLIAVGVLAAVAISLIYLVAFGIQARDDEEKFNTSVAAPDSEVKPAEDFSALTAAIAAVGKPDRASTLPVRASAAEPDLFTPERRVFCIKCASPITFEGEDRDEAQKCTICGAEQPVKEKIDYSTVDSDEDGLPDVWETANKLDPNDPTDADADNDSDGFTNAQEYQAKTDPNDAKSHPAYDGFLRVGEISGTKVPLRIINAMRLPDETGADGKPTQAYRVTFVSVSEDGTPGTANIVAKTGKPVYKSKDVIETSSAIGKSGFSIVSYNRVDKKPIKVGPHGTTQLIEVSTAVVKRDSDGKTATLTYWDKNNPEWPGEPLLEQKVELSCELSGVEPATLIEGGAYRVKSDTYVVKHINPADKTVTLEHRADKRTIVVGASGPVEVSATPETAKPAPASAAAQPSGGQKK